MRLILASGFDGAGSQHKVRPLIEGQITRALCIPTAANCYPAESRDWQLEEMNAIRACGVDLDVFDLEGQSAETARQKLQAHNTLYVTGGNVYYLLEKMQQCQFIETVRKWAPTAHTYLGASAGAVVACPDIRYIEEMDDLTQANLSNYSGLNLYPTPIMVHVDHPKYGVIANKIVSNFQNKQYPIIALNDEQALVVDEKGERIL